GRASGKPRWRESTLRVSQGLEPRCARLWRGTLVPSNRSPMTSIAEMLDLALRLHRDGRLREALEQYTIILDADPDHAAALHYSGVVLHQAGDSAGGIERIRPSISIAPNPAEPCANLALALEKVARPEAALNALLEAAKRAPNDPQVRNNLAASLLSM